MGGCRLDVTLPSQRAGRENDNPDRRQLPCNRKPRRGQHTEKRCTNESVELNKSILSSADSTLVRSLISHEPLLLEMISRQLGLLTKGTPLFTKAHPVPLSLTLVCAPFLFGEARMSPHEDN